VRVAYTPGHASHHVAYLDEASGWAFTGDVAGVRIGEGPVLAPTPPPDIDLAAWRRSLDTIERWRPRAIAASHFGAYDDVAEHLAALRAQLDLLEGPAGELDEAGFAAAVRDQLSGASAETAAAYAHAMPVDQSYQGLARYLSRRERAS
jgi:glyoxylase-like metal-dependent hydrolase (beta-lactamase superfamily II)